MNPLIALLFEALFIAICTKGIRDSKTFVAKDSWAWKIFGSVVSYLLLEVSPFADRWNCTLFGYCIYNLCETLFGLLALVALPYVMYHYRTITSKTIESKR